MDFMKTESEVDPLTVQPCDDAGKEEADPSPDEENLLDLNVTKIKEEYVDDSYNHTSKIKFEEIILPNNFPVVKCEAEEENLLHLEVTGMKTNCLDHSCDLKSEIKVEDTPEPVSFSVVKSEADEDLFDVDRVQPKQKVEVSSEEDEVFSESILEVVLKDVSQERAFIASKKNKLTQCASNRADCSNISDIYRNSIKCNICNEIFATPESLKLHFDVHRPLHTGEMQFHCDVCGKPFRRSGNLKRHALIHTSDWPFKCDVCGKCFTASSYLSSHEHIHNELKCEVCGRSFSASWDLNRHIPIPSSADYSPIKPKKRLRNKDNWKRKILNGDEYTSTPGQHIPAKTVAPDCHCKRKCTSKFSEMTKKTSY
ncbi:zinc finger protein 189-like isoform X2 [Periplaneta americana]|uniref:zinc finger protein 189-like isoform X2 n=1 Tax=Periplaneta americana TaxID=6978 RepID=UPI0037E7077C